MKKVFLLLVVSIGLGASGCDQLRNDAANGSATTDDSVVVTERQLVAALEDAQGADRKALHALQEMRRNCQPADSTSADLCTQAPRGGAVLQALQDARKQCEDARGGYNGLIASPHEPLTQNFPSALTADYINPLTGKFFKCGYP